MSLKLIAHQNVRETLAGIFSPEAWRSLPPNAPVDLRLSSYIFPAPK